MIINFRHKGLRRFYEDNDARGIRPDLVKKTGLILTALEAAGSPQEMALPMFHFHPLTGDRKG